MYSPDVDSPVFWIIVLAVAVVVVAFDILWQRRRRALRAQRAYTRKGTLLAGLSLAIGDNEPALSTRLLQLAYKDAYGSWVVDKWFKELEYFFRRHVVPSLPPTSQREQTYLLEALIHWAEGLDLDALVERFDQPHLPADGLSYERQVGASLAKVGYDVRFTPTTGDQGVDLLAERLGHKVAIQCKNYAKPVGNDAVQQVYAGARHYGATQCVVVAPSGFTTSARQLASSLGVICIHHGELESRLGFPHLAQSGSERLFP